MKKKFTFSYDSVVILVIISVKFTVIPIELLDTSDIAVLKSTRYIYRFLDGRLKPFTLPFTQTKPECASPIREKL